MGLKDSIRKLSSTLGLGGSSKTSDHSDEEGKLDLSKLQDSESESDLESEDEDNDNGANADAKNPETNEGLEAEDDVALSEAELDDDADVVPYQKVTINNQAALQRCLRSIELPASARSNFVEHLSLTASKPIELRDIYDDTERELAFYKQSLEHAEEARKLAKQHNIAFSRPVDYFAEMLKSDEHMSRVKAKLMDVERNKLGAQEARKQRELKKYGKKVQHERLQQRAKDKKEMMDKIQGLKRKRKSADIDEDRFEVEVEDALSDKKASRDAKYKLGNQASGSRKQPNRKRMAKNSKYGSGHSRGEKRNTSESSMDVSGFKNKRKK